MRSMTGYGRCRMEADGREMSIELKTVNHRFLDLSPRMPRGLLFLEDAIRKAIGARLQRGHADIFLNYSNHREDAREVRIDQALLSAYMKAYSALQEQSSLPDDRTLCRMASLPDVTSVSERDEDEEAVTQLCLSALSGALDQLDAMRVREGAALAADLESKISHLNARIAELLASPPDPQRLAQEVALFADRAAIDEELVRLRSHFVQFRACLASQEPVGRKLDFLVQELNREMNTMGSKATDIEIASLVIDGKAEIEKIREQVQNIE